MNRWVVFDYAGVLCFPPPPAAGERLAARFAVPTDQFWAAYWRDRAHYDRGAVDATWYWNGVCRELGLKLTPQIVDELVELDLSAWFHLNEGTMALLDELRTAGERLALLSNAPAEMARRVDGQSWAGIFRHRLFSADLHLVKPDPAIFDRTCDLLRAQPSEMVFIDDREENVMAAREFGIPSILFTDAEQVGKELGALR